MRSEKGKLTIDLTTGSIWIKLLLFFLPILGATLVQLMYNTVDIYFAGNVLGSDASAAIGSSSMLSNCAVGFFGGLGVGANILVSMSIGTNDEKKIHNSVHTAVMLSLISGIALILLGYLIAPWFLHRINTPDNLFEDALTYIRIYFYSMIAIIVYNMTSAIIRATGNSSFPLFVQIVGGLSNIAMDALFLHFDKSVGSIAWATMISQSTAALLCIIYLLKVNEAVKLNLRQLHIHRSELLFILRTGIPAGLQTLLISLSNVIAQSFINKLNVDSISAFTYYYRLELLIYFPIVAFGQTMTVFAGQNIGAGKVDRVKRGMRICLLLSFFVTIMISATLLLLGKELFLFFDNDPGVAEIGMRIILITFPLYWEYIILEIVGDTLRGAGNTLAPMLIIMFNICILRTLFIVVATSLRADVASIAGSYPFSWFTTDVCMVIYYLIHKKDLIPLKDQV